MVENKKTITKVQNDVRDMVKDSFERVLKQVDTMFDSDVINKYVVDKYDKTAPMVISKAIVSSLLEKQVNEYNAKGTSYERSSKKLIKELDNLILYYSNVNYR